MREDIDRLRKELRCQKEAAASEVRRRASQSEELASRARAREETAMAELEESEERRREGLLCMDELLRDAQELQVSLSTHRHLTRDLSVQLQDAKPRDGEHVEQDSAGTQAWRERAISRRSSSSSLPSRGLAAPPNRRPWSHEEREGTISSVLDSWEPSDISIARQLSNRDDLVNSSQMRKDSSCRATPSTREGSSQWARPPGRTPHRDMESSPVRSSLSLSSTSACRWSETSPPIFAEMRASSGPGRPSPSTNSVPSSIRPSLGRPALSGPHRSAMLGMPSEPITQRPRWT
uniref:Uncharacterized protein n=1 Tax=Alexandrium andersonii TaxID=327968 RepID=A0A7S2CYI8_9DINO